LATYQWDSEADGDNINEIEFDMSVVPVQAKIHPLRFRYSVPAGLAASAHLAIDVQDTLAELAGQVMKMERDNLGIKMIVDNAPHETTLDFTATPSTYYDRQSLYADIELRDGCDRHRRPPASIYNLHAFFSTRGHGAARLCPPYACYFESPVVIDNILKQQA
jgi:hypothetical protein